MARWLPALAAVALAAGPAAAQSKRYPPEPVDQDREAAQRSKLWESAVNPQRTPYGKLVFEAEQGLRERTTTAAHEARRRLDDAIKLVPTEPRAYLARAEASMFLKDWARCAADFAAARERADRALGEPRALAELRRKLGLCQARAGKLADAERTLAEAAVAGTASGEVWMRLGEVRIAMGKLEEAIAALESAAEQLDAPSALIRWLLAGAYDRARRPAESVEAARRASALDRTFATLRSESMPLLGVGEAEYLQGLAYTSLEQPRSDYALVYFRYFLHVAKDSPWRRRAEEHVRELRPVALPESLERRGGTAALDLAAAREPVRRAMPAMRACAAKTPFLIYEVVVTKAGPRTGPTTIGAAGAAGAFARSGAIMSVGRLAPPEVVTVTPVVGLPSTGDVPQAERDAVARCIEPLASRLALPAIKEKDAYYRVAFHVVAP